MEKYIADIREETKRIVTAKLLCVKGEPRNPYYMEMKSLLCSSQYISTRESEILKIDETTADKNSRVI